MTTTIKFDGIEHIGRFSQAYVDGFVFMYMRVNYHLVDDELNIVVTGACQLNPEIEGCYLGCCPIGSGPGALNGATITSREQLENYVGDYMEMDPEPGTIRRYLVEVTTEEQEDGGFERDRSFSDLLTFDDVDFVRGLYAAGRLLDQPQDETFFDTSSLTFADLATIDNEPLAN